MWLILTCLATNHSNMALVLLGLQYSPAGTQTREHRQKKRILLAKEAYVDITQHATAMSKRR